MATRHAHPTPSDNVITRNKTFTEICSDASQCYLDRIISVSHLSFGAIIAFPTERAIADHRSKNKVAPVLN
jgi:hypothetical protein